MVAEAHQHTLGVFQKPLFFERNRKRFAAFEKKIIHLVQPFAASLPVAESCSRRLLADQDACWEFEMFQRDSLLHMLAQLNAGAAGHGNAHVAPGFLQDEDLILVSDVDEIVMGESPNFPVFVFLKPLSSALSPPFNSPFCVACASAFLALQRMLRAFFNVSACACKPACIFPDFWFFAFVCFHIYLPFGLSPFVCMHLVFILLFYLVIANVEYSFLFCF